jgi:UDP-N-acetylglucosamine 4-epimerase
VEKRIGNQLSPYAVSKYANELYAKVFGRCYGLETIGLRYFNVFGPRQDPNGPYAAVIPRWIGEILAGEKNHMYGDGSTSRDFSFVENIVQANILASTTPCKNALKQLYNVACAEATALRDLHTLICSSFRNAKRSKKAVLTLRQKDPPPDSFSVFLRGFGSPKSPNFRPARKGDVRHSLANISKARRLLKYRPVVRKHAGIDKTVRWYIGQDL